MVDYNKWIMNEYFISDSPKMIFILPKFYDLHTKNRKESCKNGKLLYKFLLKMSNLINNILA